jgi:NADPH:quinone reductase
MASLKGRSGFAQLDAVVIAGREDPTTAVGRLASGPEVDIVYDAVGKDTFGQSVACLAPGGHLVSSGQASGGHSRSNAGRVICVRLGNQCR